MFYEFFTPRMGLGIPVLPLGAVVVVATGRRLFFRSFAAPFSWGMSDTGETVTGLGVGSISSSWPGVWSLSSSSLSDVAGPRVRRSSETISPWSLVLLQLFGYSKLRFFGVLFVVWSN